jgi:SecD/SecF fusion protein
VSSVSGQPAPSPLVNASVRILRQRLSTPELRGWTVESARAHSIRLSCAANCQAYGSPAAVSVVQPGQLLIYDWEVNVLDAQCRPRPASEDVTGAAAGGLPSAASTTYYRAVLRASRCPERHYDVMSRATPVYYAVDGAHERVVSGPEPSKLAAVAAARASSPRLDLGDLGVVTVLPGTTVVMAHYEHDAPRDDNNAQWYVLRDRPALTGHDVTNSRLRLHQRTPSVAISFTPEGQQRWRAVTRGIAERGTAQSRAAQPGSATFQHLAIALDQRLLTVPYIDVHRNPDGLDGRDGTVIGGGFTRASANALVALLKSGELPARLSPAPSYP